MLLDAMAERYRLALRAHADATVRLVVGPLESMSRKLFLPVAVGRIIVANVKAGNMARRYLLTMRWAMRLPPIPLPATVPDDVERLAQAVSTALVKGPGSLERLARSEPLSAAQTALSEAVLITGHQWTRHTGPDACPTCSTLADGKPIPPGVPMAVPHPSCSCTQRIVLEEP